MPRKSTIDRLPETVRLSIEDLLQEGRLTLDEILDHISQEFGEENTPSRSALGRRKQRMDKILEKHRQTSQVMKTLMRHVDATDGSAVSRGVIELMRNVVFDIAEDIAADDDPDAGAVSALALAMKRLASAEDVTLKVRQRIKEETLAEAEQKVAKALKNAPRAFDSDSIRIVREAIRGEA